MLAKDRSNPSATNHPPDCCTNSNLSTEKLLPRGVFMAEKSSFPLENPSISKDAATSLTSLSIRGTRVPRDKHREHGSSKGKDRGGAGGESKTPFLIGALVKCLQCGRVQTIVCSYQSPPPYHKCIGCGELTPTNGYRVMVYGWPPIWTH